MKDTPLLRTLIVDDERPARRHLRRLLAQEPDIDLVGEASTGEAAIEKLLKLRPDLLFLDVQLREVNGFEIIREIPEADRPMTIFVTAYDQYAIDAFDACAVDYLLKPYSDERFEAALEKARRFQLVSLGERMERLESLLYREDGSDTRSTIQYLDYIVIKNRAHRHLLPVSELLWIEASGVYVQLHTTRENILHRALLGELERQLSPRHFVRIHRSIIVQIKAIASLIQDGHGEYTVLLKDNTRLKLTRTYRANVEARLMQSF